MVGYLYTKFSGVNEEGRISRMRGGREGGLLSLIRRERMRKGDILMTLVAVIRECVASVRKKVPEINFEEQLISYWQKYLLTASI